LRGREALAGGWILPGMGSVRRTARIALCGRRELLPRGRGARGRAAQDLPEPRREREARRWDARRTRDRPRAARLLPPRRERGRDHRSTGARDDGSVDGRTARRLDGVDSAASRSRAERRANQPVSAGFWELADFVARWVHVIAGIMWIGNSLLFNWLDR